MPLHCETLIIAASHLATHETSRNNQRMYGFLWLALCLFEYRYLESPDSHNSIAPLLVSALHAIFADLEGLSFALRLVQNFRRSPMRIG